MILYFWKSSLPFIKNLKAQLFAKYTQRQRNGDVGHKVLEHVMDMFCVLTIMSIHALRGWFFLLRLMQI